MFWILALISMTGYVVQGTLMAKYARKIEGLSCAVYRNLSLGISMLPLLFLAEKSDFQALDEYWWYFLLGGIIGVFGLSATFTGIKYLPVGINASVGSSIRTLLLLLSGFIFFQEKILPLEWLFIILILAGVIFLGSRKYHMPHLDPKTLKGVFFTTIFGFTSAIWYTIATQLSRTFSPYITGYFLEISIGLAALLVGLGRQVIFKKKLQKISGRTFFKILFISSPTLLGTGGFALASTMGKVGILSLINASGIFLSALLSHFLYHENLKFSHWFGIFVIVSGIIGLKLLGG